eukprot:c3840_g1_i2.p2 GENE.c3840_g1_i2~~c3840_g1_i2.p2  ORF type:complete len:109 (-),score=8.34 c3840_g1_i2:72-398(-)
MIPLLMFLAAIYIRAVFALYPRLLPKLFGCCRCCPWTPSRAPARRGGHHRDSSVNSTSTTPRSPYSRPQSTLISNVLADSGWYDSIQPAALCHAAPLAKRLRYLEEGL